MSNGKMVIESREGCKNLTIRRKISQEKQARKFTTKGGGEQPSSPEVTISQVKMDSSLNWEPNNSNLATRTDFKRLGARPWNISFGLKTWNGFENYRKTTEKSLESFKRQFGSLWWNSFVLENHLYHWKGARLSGLKTEFVILCNVRIWCNIWSD